MDWLAKAAVATTSTALEMIGLSKLIEWLKDYGKSRREGETQRLAYRILETIKPSPARGNVFTVERIAEWVGAGREPTFSALLYLREKDLAFRNQEGWWHLGSGRDPAERVWGRH